MYNIMYICTILYYIVYRSITIIMSNIILYSMYNMHTLTHREYT